jgi:hypothetical protein
MIRLVQLKHPGHGRRVAVYAQNLTKAQWLSHLFCRVIIFFALFHSKLPV